MAGSSLDESGAQEVRTQMDVLPELCNHIQQQLDTKLSSRVVMLLQEELLVMQRSSYYLDIKCEDQHQCTSFLCQGFLWSLIDQWRLQGAMTLTKTQVKLTLSYLGLIYNKIVRGCQVLRDFVTKYDQGLVDTDMAAPMKQKLQQTCEYVDDFESTKSRNLGPLNLWKPLMFDPEKFSMLQVSGSLVMRLPVRFDIEKMSVTSSAAHLFWEITGQAFEEPDKPFEIHVKSLHPSNIEDGATKFTCQSYNMQVNGLIPDRYYQFSVKRADADNLVYALWSDTITLKSLPVKSKMFRC